MNKLKIGFFGDGPWAQYALRRLVSLDWIEVSFVTPRFNNPDEILLKIADDNKIKKIITNNVNKDDYVSTVVATGCDLLVSLSINQIFKNKLINSVPKGSINVHCGKLPFYRGRNILNWALINGEKEFGITVHYINEGIDTGDIILQQCYPIHSDDDYGTLLQKAFDKCPNILEEALTLIYSQSVTPIKQKEIRNIGFYCGGRTDGDEWIDWNNSSVDIHNFIRAIYTPGPKAHSSINGEIVKIGRSKIIKDMPQYIGIPGQIIGKNKHDIIVKTLDSAIAIYDLECSIKLRISDRFAQSLLHHKVNCLGIQ